MFFYLFISEIELNISQFFLFFYIFDVTSSFSWFNLKNNAEKGPKFACKGIVRKLSKHRGKL